MSKKKLNFTSLHANKLVIERLTPIYEGLNDLWVYLDLQDIEVSAEELKTLEVLAERVYDKMLQLEKENLKIHNEKNPTIYNRRRYNA